MAGFTKPKKSTHGKVAQGVAQIYPKQHEIELNNKTNLEYGITSKVGMVANYAFAVLYWFRDLAQTHARVGSLEKLVGTGHATSMD
jgi:hypothetical protein